MKIEVSKETFFKVFNEFEDIKSVEDKETYQVSNYSNSDQVGILIFNFVSSVDGNFYLYDINN